MNLYIESIEGGNYIARMGEKQTPIRDEYRNSDSFQSLSEIKEKVSGQMFDKVWLKQSTPYDEMCGSFEEGQKLMLELDW